MPAYNSHPYVRKPLTREEVEALIAEIEVGTGSSKIYEPMYIFDEPVLSSTGDVMMAYGGNNAS